MEKERRQLRGVAAAGAVAAAAVVGLLLWSGGPAPGVGAGDAAPVERLPTPSAPEATVPAVSVAADESAAPAETAPSTDDTAARHAEVDALVGKLPDPPSVTPIGDLDAPGRPSWLLFDTPLQTARDEYAGALSAVGLSAAAGPVPTGGAAASSVLVVSDPATEAKVLVMFEQLDTDVNVTIEDVPPNYDPSAPAGTVPPPSPEVAAIALLDALPVPESAAELEAHGGMRTFRVPAAAYDGVAWAYLAQLQEAGYTVTETDRSDGLLTVTVSDAAGGAVTVDMLDHTAYIEIVAFT